MADPLKFRTPITPPDGTEALAIVGRTGNDPQVEPYIMDSGAVGRLNVRAIDAYFGDTSWRAGGFVVSATEPSEPTDKLIWIDTSADPVIVWKIATGSPLAFVTLGADVAGPDGGVEADEIAAFDGTTGKLLKGTGIDLAALYTDLAGVVADLSASVTAEDADWTAAKPLWLALLQAALADAGVSPGSVLIYDDGGEIAGDTYTALLEAAIGDVIAGTPDAVVTTELIKDWHQSTNAEALNGSDELIIDLDIAAYQRLLTVSGAFTLEEMANVDVQHVDLELELVITAGASPPVMSLGAVWDKGSQDSVFIGDTPGNRTRVLLKITSFEGSPPVMTGTVLSQGVEFGS